MYGSSSEYDYGFTPANVYAEWRKMPQFCTNEPLIWQREYTVITMQSDDSLMKAQIAAQAYIHAGENAKAVRVLESAIRSLNNPVIREAASK